MMNSEIVDESTRAAARISRKRNCTVKQTVMRIGLGNVLTTEQHLRNVWQLIQTTAGEVTA